MTRVSSVIMVEGAGDQNAVKASAERFGRDLEGAGVSVVGIGGLSAFAEVFDDLQGPHGSIWASAS